MGIRFLCDIVWFQNIRDISGEICKGCENNGHESSEEAGNNRNDIRCFSWHPNIGRTARCDRSTDRR